MHVRRWVVGDGECPAQANRRTPAKAGLSTPADKQERSRSGCLALRSKRAVCCSNTDPDPEQRTSEAARASMSSSTGRARRSTAAASWGLCCSPAQAAVWASLPAVGSSDKAGPCEWTQPAAQL